MYLNNDVKNCIVKFLINKINPQFIYLFCSLAKGEGRDDSDIDLAIYTEKVISPYHLYIISNQLFFEVKRDVQTVNLKDIDTVFAAQIIGNREELYWLKDNIGRL